MNIASQKPYSPSSSVGSLKMMVLETCSPDRRCTLTNGMKKSGGVAADEAKNYMHWWLMVVLWSTSVAAAHIYREDLPRVKTSHNRLGLSLSKHIRHRLVAKNKRKGDRGPLRLWTEFR
jgi:hypothetical protein